MSGSDVSSTQRSWRRLHVAYRPCGTHNSLRCICLIGSHFPWGIQRVTMETSLMSNACVLKDFWVFFLWSFSPQKHRSGWWSRIWSVCSEIWSSMLNPNLHNTLNTLILPETHSTPWVLTPPGAVGAGSGPTPPHRPILCQAVRNTFVCDQSFQFTILGKKSWLRSHFTHSGSEVL